MSKRQLKELQKHRELTSLSNNFRNKEGPNLFKYAIQVISDYDYNYLSRQSLLKELRTSLLSISTFIFYLARHYQNNENRDEYLSDNVDLYQLENHQNLEILQILGDIIDNTSERQKKEIRDLMLHWLPDFPSDLYEYINDNSPEILETFWYTLRDENDTTNHGNSAQVVAHKTEDYDLIKSTFYQAGLILNNPESNQDAMFSSLKDVVNGVGSYFNNFLYHSASNTPLTDKNLNILPDQAQIVWDGQRIPASPDGTLFATYKEVGNIITPDGNISFNQIYPDEGSNQETTVPFIAFQVTGGTGKYADNDQTTMLIEYDNDGTIFGDGSRKFIRRLRLVKGDWNKLLEQEA